MKHATSRPCDAGDGEGEQFRDQKVKAETLDGRFCSKNKCKVFDQIVCKM